MWKEGRKEESNPCGLSITDSAFYVYISLQTLIHSGPFTFFFFSGILCLTLNSQNLFLDCKLVAFYVIFALPGRYLLHYSLHLPD